MELTRYEFYSLDLESLVTVRIWGFCSYCRNYIPEDEEYKEKKNKIYHQECWEQMKR